MLGAHEEDSKEDQNLATYFDSLGQKNKNAFRNMGVHYKKLS